MQDNILLATVFYHAAQFQARHKDYKSAALLYRRALKELRIHGSGEGVQAGLILMDLADCLALIGDAESSHQTFTEAVDIMRVYASQFLPNSPTHASQYVQ